MRAHLTPLGMINCVMFGMGLGAVMKVEPYAPLPMAVLLTATMLAIWLDGRADDAGNKQRMKGAFWWRDVPKDGPNGQPD